MVDLRIDIISLMFVNITLLSFNAERFIGLKITFLHILSEVSSLRGCDTILYHYLIYTYF